MELIIIGEMFSKGGPIIWMAQLCKTDILSDFFRWNFLSFKRARIVLHMLFNFCCKTVPCIFLAGLHFVSEKNEDKNN